MSEPPPVVHHLALARDWEDARRDGAYRVSTLGATLDEVGFVHASFPWQLAATAARFYGDVTEALVVLVIDTRRLGCPVAVEAAAGGERFPHVYGPIPVDAVRAALPVRLDRGRLVADHST